MPMNDRRTAETCRRVAPDATLTDKDGASSLKALSRLGTPLGGCQVFKGRTALGDVIAA